MWRVLGRDQANGGMVDSLIFVDEGHGSGKRPNVITEYRKQVEFLDQHLKKSEMTPRGEQPSGK